MPHRRLARTLTSVSPLVAALACQPVPQKPAEATSEPTGTGELLVRAVPEAGTTLVFPPVREDRRERPALEVAEADDTDPNTGFRVQSPKLEEGDDTFEVEGQTVRVVLNRPAVLPRPIKKGKPVPAAPGTLTISPEVAGKASWTSPNVLEFAAKAPFDPATTYTVAVAGVKTEDGVQLAPWSAKFTAEPRIEIAGKVITYMPVPGEPAVVEVFPHSGSKIAAGGSMFVVFDQPVKPKDAAELISLRVGPDEQKATDVAAALSNARSGRIEGYSLNPRQVIEVRGKRPLPADAEVLLSIDTPSSEDYDETVYRYSVAGPLALTKVGCGYGYDRSVCEWSSPRLRTDGRELILEFSNRLAVDRKAIQSAISVTPTVANLNVWANDSWDGTGRLSISGALEPSTEYTFTIPALKDSFGHDVPGQQIVVETAPLAASVSMPEGVLILDAAASRAFTVTSRNVAAGKLRAWLVQDDLDALKKAREQVAAHELPSGAPAVELPFRPASALNQFVKTPVDLLAHLAPGKNYVVTVDLGEPAFAARPVEYPSWMSASRSPMALVTPGDDKALAVHTHVTPEATLVHVARLASGEPVPGARFSLGGKALDGRVTDALGFAVLPVGTAQAASGLLAVEAGGTRLQVPLQPTNRDARLFPDLAAESAPLLGDRRALVITDRGIYRPGSKVFIKASVRRKLGEQLVPLAATPVHVRVLGPTDDELADLALVTDDMGSVAGEYDIPPEARVGRHRIEVVEAAEEDRVLDESVIQVAEFEPPRFTVDVDAALAGAATLRAKVLGKYLFGAAMDGAQAEWTLTRAPAKLPGGPFTDGGFHFYDDRHRWWEDGEEGEGGWSRSGSGKLAADGTLAVTQKLDLGGAASPQEFTFEADVADTSYRHIAGRGSVVVHPAAHYVGVKIDRPWGDVGAAVPVQLGVIDHDGKPVEGLPVAAKLNLVEWSYSRRPHRGGGYDYQWQRTVRQVDTCTATSARSAVTCELTPPENGSYEVVASVDGRDGGVTSMWAWGSGDRKTVPSRGRTIDIIADKGRYRPGETARLMVQNPFPAATAIFTLEQGGLLSHQVVRLDEAAKVFEVPIQAGHAPHVHATVTLLPIGAGDERTDWKIGALRIPVTLDDVRLTAGVKSDRDTYEPREPVTVTIDVADKGAPVAGAEVALAVVDEGILRMTNFHAADPATALRPGQPLHFEISDSRDRLAALLEHSQTAGDGAGDGTSTTTNARKNFLQTAYWKPDLRTDSQGRATATFTLPDNLTRFRMMAVVIDKTGKGAAAEGDFTVRRPVMMVPVVPRFAAVGDSFEAAAMVHNNTDQPLAAKVTLNGAETRVTVAPQGHERVGFPLKAERPGELALDFSVHDGARVRDAVVQKLPVDVAGLPEHPHLDGAFVGEQQIRVQVPATARTGRGDQDFVTVQVGQHLWPELGARMSFLLDYPHGCVEQTTSGTLPLLAAKDILPRIGVTGMSQAELDKRIEAGLARLASMRTGSGGLGYWPGDNTPNVYGTAYAARAVIGAKKAGVRLPDGLLAAVEEYLKERLLSDGIEAEVQAAIAQSLAELGSLPPSAADALFDRKGDQGVFGLASLAIALHALPGQEDRVKELLDAVEAAFDGEGELLKKPGHGDFYYYGSPTRTRAQAAIALGRLRPGSPLQVKLVQRLAQETDDYTTQSTAYSLMAVAEQIRGVPDAGAAFTVTLGGAELTPSADLGAGSKEFRVPLAELRGQDASLVLRSDSKAALAFIVRGKWKRDLGDARGMTATSAKAGPDVYRVITDARGEAVDLTAVKPGTVLRVALLADLPHGDLDGAEMNYLAITDRLPAGFEPIQPDLWTVARAPEISDKHPFADMLRWGGSDASYLELRDDRVHVYFDRVWGERVLATYLVRASTPGTFVLPPAAGEFMYVGDSLGYSSAGSVTVK